MKKGVMEELLTLSEVSRLLKVHPNTLRAWDKNGVLKAVRFGMRGDRKYKREEVNKILH